MSEEISRRNILGMAGFLGIFPFFHSGQNQLNNTINRKYIENLIYKGVNQNILVYDSSAKLGELTTKLIGLVRQVAKYNLNTKNIKEIYIFGAYHEQLKRVLGRRRQNIKIENLDYHSYLYFYNLGGITADNYFDGTYHSDYKDPNFMVFKFDNETVLLASF